MHRAGIGRGASAPDAGPYEESSFDLMGEEKADIAHRGTLRHRPEESVRNTTRGQVRLKSADLQRLLQDLKVHERELERKNTKLRKNELELEASRDRYAHLYEVAPISIVAVSLKGVILEANLAASRLFGVERTRLIGSDLGEFFHENDRKRFLRFLRTINSTSLEQRCELDLHTRQRRSIPVQLTGDKAKSQETTSSVCRLVFADLTERKQMEAVVEESRARLEGIVESAMDAIVSIDENERIIMFNRAAERMFLCPKSEAMGGQVERFIAERFREVYREHLRRVARGRGTARGVGHLGILVGVRTNVEEFPIEASISQEVVLGKRIFTLIHRDITTRRKEERRQRVEHDATQFIAEATSVEGGSVHILQSICEALGWEVGALWNPDHTIKALRCTEVWHTPSAEVKEFVARTRTIIFPPGVGLPGRVWASGKPAWIPDVVRDTNFPRAPFALKNGLHAAFGFPVVIGGEVIGVIEFFSRQIEEPDEGLLHMFALLGNQIGQFIQRKQAEESLRGAERALLKSQDELRLLAAQLLTAQEEERRRISRDLHDDINQRLATIAVEIETLERHPPASQELLRSQLGSARDQLARLSDDVHSMAYGLHSSLLIDVGLQAALQDHVSDFTKRTNIKAVFLPRRLPASLPLEMAVNLYRITQECLHNVAKHSKASSVVVKVIGTRKGLALSVRDWGVGFDPSILQGTSRGLGLRSIRERVRLMRARLFLRSRPKRGTRVGIWLPLPKESL